MPARPTLSWWLPLLCFLLSGVTTAQIEPRTTADYLKVVVQVRPADNPNSFGSGTLISPQGYILTNHHVVSTGTGNTASTSSTALIYLSSTATDTPKFRYIARVEKSDRALDLALLRIVADNTGTPIASGTKFPFVKIARRSSLQLGDQVTIWGYPGLSGPTITNTVGVISGFTGENLASAGNRWIKTDGKILGGNSGGAGFVNGYLALVPTVTTFRNSGVQDTQDWGRPADLISELRTNVAGLVIGNVPTRSAGTKTAPTTSTSSAPSTQASRVPSDGVARTAEQLLLMLERGGTVKVARGTYHLPDGVTLTRNVTLHGEGASNTIIASNAPDSVLRSRADIAVELRDVTVRHTETRSANAISFDGLRRVTLVNVNVEGAAREKDITSHGHGAEVRNTDSVTFDNLTAANNKVYGVLAERVGALNIQNSSFHGNAAGLVIVDVKTSAVKSSRFRSHEGGTGLYVESKDTPSKLTLSASQFDGNDAAIQCVEANCTLREVTVRQHNHGIRCIRDATCVINAAQFTDLTSDVMRCEGACKITDVTATGTANSKGAGLFCLRSSSCDVSNLTLRGNGRPFAIQELAKVKIADSKLEFVLPQTGDAGAWVRGNGTLELRNVQMRYGSLLASDRANVSFVNFTLEQSATGVVVEKDAVATMRATIMKDSGFTRTTNGQFSIDCSLTFRDAARADVDTLTVTGSKSRGVCAFDNANVQGGSVTASGNARHGFAAYGRAKVQLTALTANRNTGAGLGGFDSVNMEVMSVTLDQNEGFGMVFEDAANVRVNGGSASNNKIGAYLKSALVFIRNVTFQANRDYGVGIDGVRPSVTGSTVRGTSGTGWMFTNENTDDAAYLRQILSSNSSSNNTKLYDFW